jgi:phage terminase large subunit
LTQKQSQRRIDLQTPRWAVPLLKPAPYKGAYGGRGSGKSHFFAELAVEECLADPSMSVVCIREIQKSLKFSAKKLIETKIRDMNVGLWFDVQTAEIKRRGLSGDSEGVIIFQGMQDHTADSIKSLEGFRRAWVEEGQNLSARSLELLRPTIRADDSEIWFSWNPDQPDDPVDNFLRGEQPPDGMIVVQANYLDNPFLPEKLLSEAEQDRQRDYEKYQHVWLGGYNTKSDAQIFNGKWVVREFDISKFGDKVKGPRFLPDGPYFGADWGFAQDPTALVRCWIWDGKLWIDYAIGAVGLDITDTNELFCEIPGADTHKIRGDNSRPETISHLRKPWTDSEGKKRNGLNVVPADKWQGSVEDGITYIRTFDQIVIHPRCKPVIHEALNYKYKVDRLSGDILPIVVDKDNHYWDATRYALGPMIKASKGSDLSRWL